MKLNLNKYTHRITWKHIRKHAASIITDTLAELTSCFPFVNASHEIVDTKSTEDFSTSSSSVMLGSSPDISQCSINSNVNSSVNLSCGHCLTTSPVQSQCHFCGGGAHIRKMCPAKDNVCSYCNTKGHVSQVCETRIRISSSKSFRSQIAFGLGIPALDKSIVPAFLIS